MEQRHEDEEVQSGPVTHGGEGDPLGGGVSDLEDDAEGNTADEADVAGNP